MPARKPQSSGLRGLANRLARAWRHPAAGEFGPSNLGNTPLRTSGVFWGPGYQLGTTPQDESRVNYEKARALYANTLPEYKLGAGFARPIINSTAGFMGVPTISHQDDVPAASDAVANFFSVEQARLYLGSRDCLRDGDAFLRIVYEPDRFNQRRRFHVRPIVPDYVTPIPDVLNGGWRAVEIRYPVTPPWPDRPYTVLETLTSTTRRVEIEGDAPDEARAYYVGEQEQNRWGLIPICHFKNETGPEAPFGKSDLEPLEPLFRAYHDTLLIGIGGIQLFAKPKVQFQLHDVDRFIADNFPEASRHGGQINFQGSDLLFMTDGEQASFLTADPGTAGVVSLLELLFYLIVQTSETPEFIMGNAIASSRASAETQLTPYSKHIERKRLAFGEPYQELGSLYLAMADQVGLVPELDMHDTSLSWGEITPKDETSMAGAIRSLMDAFVAGVQAGLVSAEAAAEFLRPFVTSMLPWSMPNEETDEQRRIVAGFQFIEAAQAGGVAVGAVGAAPAPVAPVAAAPPPIDYAAILERINAGVGR